MIAAVVAGGLGGVLLAGLPGFGFFALADAIGSTFDFRVEKRMGSNLWGGAILVSLAWPAVFVPLSLLVHRLAPQMAWTARVALCLVGALLFGLLAAFGFALIAW